MAYRPMAELTPEEREKRRAKNRNDAARLRARRRDELNRERRERYARDPAERARRQAAARADYRVNSLARNIRRSERKEGVFVRESHQWRALAGWRWAGEKGFMESASEGYELAAWDWYERWFESLEEGAEPIW